MKIAREETMKIQRLLIALTVFNLGLLAFLLAQIEVRFLGFRFLLRSVEVNSVGSVLRGRAIEITDDEGRVRASIKVYPASVLPNSSLVVSDLDRATSKHRSDAIHLD